MLKKWTVLYAPDANAGLDSSTKPDDNGAVSSTAEEQVAETTETATAEPAEESTTTETETVEQVEPEVAEEAVAEVKVPLDKPEDEKLPFHKEPRFQEVIAEKNQYKADVERMKPLAERAEVLQQYLTTHNIAGTELQSALEYLRCLKTDPARAFEMLRPTYEELSQFTGMKLPVDLEEAVGAGTLAKEHAVEIAKARSQQKFQQAQQQRQGEQAGQQQQAAVQGAINSWADAKMKTDPDLKPKAAGAVDGKWEFLDMKLRSMRQQQPPKTAQEALVQVEQAYSDANKFFGTFRQQRQVVKPKISSTSSTPNSNPVVKNAQDVVRAILSGKKPADLRY